MDMTTSIYTVLLIFLLSITHVTSIDRIIAITKCEDGFSCFNGSKCIELEKGYKSPMEGRRYRCDCSQTDGEEYYAGYGCEYDATESCIMGAANAGGVSFCTNGGQCTQVWHPTEDEEAVHKGCDCKDGWEGLFCEYRKGETPYKNKLPRLNKLGLTLGITIPIVVFVIGLLYYRRRDGNRQGGPGESPALSTEKLKADQAEII